jgi:hypothetical protein
MTDGPEWFAPKRYGYGSGLPISWQGWLITVGFIVLSAIVGARFSDRPAVVFAILIPAVCVLMLIAAKTTRGGWRWRWGEDD